MLDGTTTYDIGDRLPAVEPVTLSVRSLSGSNSDTTLTVYNLFQARRKKLAKVVRDEKAVNELIWQVFQRSLDWASVTDPVTHITTAAVAPNPKRGDDITDQFGVVFVIEDVPESKLFGGIWNCRCKVKTPVAQTAGA